jgi:UDP-N-acetylmuramate--alanine ligase
MVHIHLIGIGGSGLSAIARFLCERGYTVSGSDQVMSPLAVELQSMGMIVSLGHRAENVAGADLVIRSSAIPQDNVEIQAAIKSGIPVYKRSEFMGKLIEDRFGIAVAGTHGKTTTSAMLAWMMMSLGLDPSYIIGGISENLGNNAHAGEGDFFVIEADEYDRMFLGLHPRVAVVTNVEHDHPDCFPTFDDFFQAFLEFFHNLPKDGILIACFDDDGSKQLLKIALQEGLKTISYGLSPLKDQPAPDLYVKEMSMDEDGNYTFDAYFRGQYLEKVSLCVPGKHNVQNALASLAVACELDFPLKAAAQSLGEYQGTKRRFELQGEIAGITVIDDYAHHPTEIKATLSAARNRFPGRQLWAVWQPHTYSRTRTLLKDYLTAFGSADHVLVTEIYAARERNDEDFSSQQVVQEMVHPDVRFIENNQQATDYLLNNLQGGDVLVVLSAGDADQISRDIVVSLSNNGNVHNA